jgi:hypothetical protein
MSFLRQVAQCWGFLCLCMAAVASAQTPTPEQLSFFESKVRPVLVERCYSCHSSKAKTPFAGLKLDSREGHLRGGDRGPSVIPGKPEDSLLIQAVRHKVVQMPPGAKLPDEQVQALEQWVRMGAPWPEERSSMVPSGAAGPDTRASHWAWQPLRLRRHLPVDQFIEQQLSAKGLALSPPADRRTLIRRLSYDLTGLPPTFEDTVAFVADPSPQATEKLVDRLIASPQFGERWARYWLDLARYSDAGFNNVRFPYAFTYRDWVIQAFNTDMPYDQFVRRQLAADRLNDQKHLPALGLLSLGYNPPRATLIPDKVDDRIDVVSRTFLALTVSCARCHDHKYDPIPTKDYYSLYGVFVNSFEPEVPAVVDSAATPLDAFYLPRLDLRLNAINNYKKRRIEEIRAEMREPAMLERYVTTAYEAASLTAPQVENLAKERNLNQYVLRRWLDFLAKNPGKPAAHWIGQNPQEPTEIPYEAIGLVQVEGDGNTINNLRWQWDRVYADYAYRAGGKRAMAVADKAELEQAHVFVRGNMNDLGDPVPRRFLSILSKPGAAGEFTHGSGRLDLANAILDKTNPLPARVWANRIWQHLFGEGIVRTPSDFGIRGDAPTHPELLDELAQTLIADGWSTKRLIRRIVLSRAYQQASADSPKARLEDPENKLLWRMNRRRLDFDALRDTLLAASGQLDRSVGGPSFSLYATPTEPRRTLYSYVEREKAQMLLKSFDYADPEQHTPQRHLTTVPQQALFFLNSTFIGDQARSLASRADLREAVYDGAGIERLYKLVLGRKPASGEVDLALRYLRQRGEQAPIAEADREIVWQHGYGELDPQQGRVTAFHPFRYFADNQWQGATLLPARESGNAFLSANGGAPGDDLKSAVIRRWIAPVDGRIQITGKLTQGFGPYEQRFHLSNGIRGWVVSSRQGVLGSWTIDPVIKTENFTPNENVSRDTNVETTVTAGEFIDFIVDSRDDYESDDFSWSPTITHDSTKWEARKGFQGPRERPLTPWQEYAQVLLLTNEAAFID